MAREFTSSIHSSNARIWCCSISLARSITLADSSRLSPQLTRCVIPKSQKVQLNQKTKMTQQIRMMTLKKHHQYSQRHQIIKLINKTIYDNNISQRSFQNRMARKKQTNFWIVSNSKQIRLQMAEVVDIHWSVPSSSYKSILKTHCLFTVANSTFEFGSS